jgi:preprotein translocase subunit SecG
MNTFNLLENVTAVDVVAFLLFVSSLYLCFFTNYGLATLYMATVAIFFFGISFIVDAITRNTTVIINVSTTDTN